jgi:hypothetical protein
MPYQFPPDVEKLVKQQMVDGACHSENDLLRDALQALDAQRNAVFDADPVVIDGIRRGLDELKAGRFQPLAEFDPEFRVRHGIPVVG